MAYNFKEIMKKNERIDQGKRMCKIYGGKNTNNNIIIKIH